MRLLQAQEVFTSDSENNLEVASDDDDLVDFQPFASPDSEDNVPIIDDFLALPPPLHL
ncbi:hypothetical protein Hanom_Chr17g01580611 [Helianthus anomalus]